MCAIWVRITYCMSPPFPPRIAPRWPFWLLVFAWICANGPQGACLEVISWMQGAASFSHQERLASGVAELLVDQSSDVTALAEAPADEPGPPALPAETTIKRIELAVADRCELAAPHCTDRGFFGWRGLQPALWTAEVPYPPPRDRA